MSHSTPKFIKAIIIEPGKAACPAEIPSDLASLQEKVGGLIQVLYPFRDPVAVICNDEGKLIGLPWNRPPFDDAGHICDVIAGTFLVVGLSEDDFDSLTDGQIKNSWRCSANISDQAHGNLPGAIS